MLSIALFAALRIGSRSLDGIVDRTTATNGLAATDVIFQKTLQATYPQYVPGPSAHISGTVLFEGSAASVGFIAPALLALAPGGMARMQVSVKNDGATKDLVIVAQPELAWPGRNRAIKEILAANIAGGNFSYWGPDAPNAAPYWHSTWQNRPSLPRLVRIKIAFLPDDRRYWPDLIVALQIRADQGCQFISLTQSCFGR